MLRFFSSPWIKVTIATGIIALLIYFNRVDTTVLLQTIQAWPWLLAAFVLMFPPFLIVSFRFKIILSNQGIYLPLFQVVRLTMIGSLFDLVMPSSNGGDLVKAGMMARYVGAGKKTQAVMAVAFDRVLGLLGLFVLVLIASGVGWNMLQDMPARHMVVGMALVSSTGILLFLRLAGSRRLCQNPAINRIFSEHAWGMRIQRLVFSFNSLQERPRYLSAALALSVVNHIFWCASLFCLVRVVGAAVDPVQGFVVFPLAIFTNIFGIAGGFGGGTVGFDLLLSQLLAIGNGAVVGLLFQALSALARLAGLPFYFISPPAEEVRTEDRSLIESILGSQNAPCLAEAELRKPK